MKITDSDTINGKNLLCSLSWFKIRPDLARNSYKGRQAEEPFINDLKQGSSVREKMKQIRKIKG